jgi:EmrB/QacA subfamily drug resistance transporter
MAITDAPPATKPAPTLDPRRWWMLGVLCLSLLIVFVGNSSLNVTIPTLSRELHATESQLQWVVASYSLVFAGLLFSTGALGDRFGRKGALQFGLVGFLVGASLAAASTAMWQLIACRALMGAAAAFIMPSTLSIIVNVFPVEERTKAIAFWAATTGAAGAVGPVASGWLLGHFWFGSVFLVNIPIIVLALVLGYFLVPKSRDPEEARLDPVGAGLSIIGISSLVYGLIQGPSNGWASPTTLGAFAISLLVLGLFAAWELRVDEPMLDLHYFQHPAFSTGTGGMILVFMAMFGVMFLITQYFQLVLNYSPLSAALRLLPMAPIMIIVAPLTPRLSEKFGANRVVTFGLVIVALGLLSFRTLGLHTAYLQVLIFMCLLVTGIALTMSPMTAAIMSSVPPRRAGAGSAMNDATRELGASLGIAVLGSLAATRNDNSLHHSLRGLTAAQQTKARGSLAGALNVADQLRAAPGKVFAIAAQNSFVNGVHMAVTGGAILVGVSAIAVARWLPREFSHQEGVEIAVVEEYV